MHVPLLFRHLGALLLIVSPCLANSAKLVTYAKTHGTYERQTQPEQPTTFRLIEGQTNFDAPNGVDFDEMTYVLNDALSTQGFVKATSSDECEQIIIVHRGRTDPRRGQQSAPLYVENARQSRAQVMNLGSTENNLREIARVLGFHEAIGELMVGNRVPSTDFKLHDLISELDQERYYVVLAAYDGAALARSGRRVLLWETRFSFQAEDRSFADRYGAMILAGSSWLGRDTRGELQRKFVKLEHEDGGPDARLLAMDTRRHQ